MYKFALSTSLWTATLFSFTVPLACSTNDAGSDTSDDDDDGDDDDDDDDDGDGDGDDDDDDDTSASDDDDDGDDDDDDDDASTSGDDDDDDDDTTSGDDDDDDDDDDTALPAGMIDNMEDGDLTINIHEGRTGYWYSQNDDTKTGEISLKLEKLPEAREKSTKAAHLSAKGFTDWGAGAAIQLLEKPEDDPRYDASKYEGIRFWIRQGTTSGASAQVRLNFADAQTDPRGKMCKDQYAAKLLRVRDIDQTGTDETTSEEDSSGDNTSDTGSDDTSSSSDTTSTTDDTESCFDHFGAELKLTDKWTKVELKFSELKQSNWGKKFDKLDVKNLYTIEFALEKSATHEFWIDDIAFF